MPPFTDHSSISVVVPIFDEERTLEELSRRLTSVLTQTALAYEILFVNDGSRGRLSRHPPRPCSGRCTGEGAQPVAQLRPPDGHHRRARPRQGRRRRDHGW